MNNNKNALHGDGNKSGIQLNRIVKVFLTTAVVSTTTAIAQENDEEEIFELSPFVVSSEGDRGYYASQTLSGGRTNSLIEDIGSSIQAVTEEMLEDIAAVSESDLLVYTTSTDVAGSSGNFTGSLVSNGSQSDVDARINAGSLNRIRGIAAADRTRDYFKTDIPFDPYNSGRVDLLRGPNSFLFGLGSPGGIINYNLDRAEFRDFGEFGTRFTNEDLSGGIGSRANILYNKELVRDRLAVLVASVYEDRNWKQEPTGEEYNRNFAALSLRLLKDKPIILRVHHESGRQEGVRPSVFGPLDNLSVWLDNPTNLNFGGPANRFIGDPHTNIVNDLGWQGNDADGNPLEGWPRGDASSRLNKRWVLVYDDTVDSNGHPTRAFQSRIPSFFYAPGDPVLDPDGSLAETEEIYFDGTPNLSDMPGYNSWNNQGFTDYSLYDFSKTLITGGVDSGRHDWENNNVTLEATGLNNQVGVEIAFNQEKYERTFFLMSGSPDIMMDVNRTVPVGPNSLFGATNPNFGRLFILGYGAKPYNESERESVRATAFGKLNFKEKFDNGILKWFGRHNLTVLADADTLNERRIEERLYTLGNDAGYHLDASDATSNHRQTPLLMYISDPQPAAFTNPDFSLSDFEIYPINSSYNVNFPDNYSVDTAYWDRGATALGDESPQVAPHTPRWEVSDGRLSETTVDSIALNLQSHFLNDHLVVNLGWREDEWESKEATAPADPTRENIRNIDPSVFNLDNAEPLAVSNEAFAYNAVLKVPDNLMPEGMGLSFHYGKSENFIPNLVGYDTNGILVPSSSGEGKDYGFTVRAFDDKLIVRVNWYETNIKNEFYNPVLSGFKTFTSGILLGSYADIQREVGSRDKDGDGLMDAGDANQNGYLDHLEGNGNSYMSFDELKQLEQALGEIVTPWMREITNYTYTPSINGSNPRTSFTNELYFRLSDTADVSGTGMETEIIYNPTRSWRFMLSVTQQEAVRSNIAPRFTEVMNKTLAALASVPSAEAVYFGGNKLGQPLFADPANTPTSLLGRVIGFPNAGGKYYSNKALEGTSNPEVREWRVNLICNYRFLDGKFNGANIGGAYRYTDSAAAGYGLTTVNNILQTDPSQAFYDDSESVFDLWVGYQFNLKKGVRWKMQLNVRNVFADDDPRVTLIHPDGSAGRVRYPIPRTFLITNTISF